jgi:centrosomal protein CEP72
MSLEELQRLQEMVHTRESELAMKNDLLSRQEEEISEMRKHLEELLHQVDQKEHERRSDLSRKRQLEQAEKDLMTVQKHVHKLQTENSHLLLKLEEQRSQTNVHELQEEIATAKQENACLRIELQKVAQQCQVDEEASNQMRKVVSMLQESHQSLVSTNSHLMHELQESKQRHAREIEQMHLNYEHLRKTVDIIHRT